MDLLRFSFYEVSAAVSLLPAQVVTFRNNSEKSGMFSISRTKQHDNPQFPPPPRILAAIDLFIILVIGVLSYAAFPALSSLQPDEVSVYRDNKIVATYPLATDRTLRVSGELDTMVIAIENGSVSVIKADCPHGICQKTGAIRTPHAQIICAPNHILITITSSESDSLDAIVR